MSIRTKKTKIQRIKESKKAASKRAKNQIYLSSSKREQARPLAQSKKALPSMKEKKLHF